MTTGVEPERRVLRFSTSMKRKSKLFDNDDTNAFQSPRDDDTDHDEDEQPRSRRKDESLPAMITQPPPHAVRPRLLSINTSELPMSMQVSPRSARMLQETFDLMLPLTSSAPTSPAGSLHLTPSAAMQASVSMPMLTGDTGLVPVISPRHSRSAFQAVNAVITGALTPPSQPALAPLTFPITPTTAPFIAQPLNTALPATPLAVPDSKAFEREASIEKKRRTNKSRAIPRPALSHARSTPLMSVATPSTRRGRFLAPAPREQRYIPPSTPMKTPISLKDTGATLVYQSPFVTQQSQSHFSTPHNHTPARTLRSTRRKFSAAVTINNSSHGNTPTRALFKSMDESEHCENESNSTNTYPVVNLNFNTNDTNSPIFSTNFENHGELGRGDFGVVYKALCLADNHYYAVKKSLKPFRSTAERLRGLKEVEHFALLVENNTPPPNIVLVHRAWIEEHYLYIQSEYVSGGTLKDFLTNSDDSIAEDLIWDWAAQLLVGLQSLHTKSLIHLDVKPANIFVTSDGLLKLGDLGTSLKCDSQGHSLLSIGELEEGDSQYIAPELLDHTLGKVGTYSDLFSLGLTLFEIAADVLLPTRGEAWNQLRNECIDWNGSHYYITDSPLTSSVHAAGDENLMTGSQSANGSNGRNRLTPSPLNIVHRSRR